MALIYRDMSPDMEGGGGFFFDSGKIIRCKRNNIFDIFFMFRYVKFGGNIVHK